MQPRRKGFHDHSSLWACDFLAFSVLSLTLQSLFSFFVFRFPCFFGFRFPLIFCAFFLSFPRILGFREERNNPCFFQGFPCFFSKKARVGGSGFWLLIICFPQESAVSCDLPLIFFQNVLAFLESLASFFCKELIDGPAIRNANRGDSRELIRANRFS